MVFNARKATTMASEREKLFEDIPLLTRGLLTSERAQALRDAAETDPELQRAIEQDQHLEQWLGDYDTPEPVDGYKLRFWQRFHEERVSGASAGKWMLRLVAPAVAALVVGLGIFIFMGPDDTPNANVPQTATDKSDDLLPGIPEVGAEPQVDWEYLTDEIPHERGDLSPEDWELLRELDKSGYSDLDTIRQPEDLRLVDDLELLKNISEQEDQE